MKMLVVEDDFVSRCVLTKLLQPHGTVHTAINGAEAIEAFRMGLEQDEPYDLLCLDIMMPEVDGQEALRQIREEEDKRKIGGLDRVKVIMTTALDDPKNIMKAFREQCEAYLIKPIRSEKLHEQLVKMGLVNEAA